MVAKPSIVGTIHQTDGSITIVPLRERNGHPVAHRNPNGHKRTTGYLLACHREIVVKNDYATVFVSEDGTPIAPKCGAGRRLRGVVVTDTPVVGVSKPRGVPQVIFHRFTIGRRGKDPDLKMTFRGKAPIDSLPPHLVQYAEVAMKLATLFP